MTDDEIKEDCLTEAGIDLGRYSYTELTQIKDALRRYSQAKLNLLTIPVVVKSLPNKYCPQCGEPIAKAHKFWCIYKP
jgi:hypothetical protein